MTWGDDLAELERWFRLTPADMAIVLGARGQPQRLERALMLTWMRAERTLASDVQGLPSPIIIYVAEQLHLTSAVLKGYRSHQQTRSVAAEAIREHLEVRTCTSADRQRLHGMLCEKVAHTGNTTALIQAAEDWLKEHHILKPTGETTIERLVYAARAEAEDRLFAQIAAHLSPEQQASLDAVCAPGTHDSQLAGFVKPPRNASAPAIVQECQRLKDMRAILIDAIEWGTITPNRLRQWAAVVRRLSAQALRRYVPEKRYTHLLAFVTVRCEEITNVIVEMFDVLVGKIFDKSDEGVETTKAKRAQVLQQGARHMRKIYDILVDAAIPPDKVRDAVFKYLPRERWMEHNTLYDAFERGEVTFLFEILERRFQHLRSFAPTVFQALQVASPRESNPLVEGLQVLSTLEGKTGRASQIPASTTVAFVPAKWKKAVQPDENAVHRQAWEMTLMHEVRNALRSGDLTVTGSQRYAAWDSDLYSREVWEQRRETWYTETGLPQDGTAFVTQVREEVDALTHQVAARIPRTNTAVRIINDTIHVDALDKIELPPEVEQTRTALLRSLPRPGLPDLLMEVDEWVHFTDAFAHLTSRRTSSADQQRFDRTTLLAALIAEGTNLGLATMAHSSGIAESQLQRMADWYLREETIREAITQLIQYQHSQPLAAKFGSGTTSSSDGIRFGVAASALHGRHQPRYFGVKRGVTLINHVSDQGSQFWIDVVNCQLRESTYVLDGLVHQDTFPIKEHYTDTGGFTELLFGCFELLGFRFAPRLKDLPDQVLSRMNKSAHYGVLDTVMERAVREALIVDQWDDMNRMTASFKDGLATPSVVIGKLQSMQRQNPIQQAIQELGRICKTRHILQFIDDEAFRRRVLIGLNRGERVNQLARVLFFGQQGRFTHREYETQVHRATALSLLINAVIVWNTRYLEAASAVVGDIPDDIWTHISPISWEHVLINGSYDFTEQLLHGELL